MKHHGFAYLFIALVAILSVVLAFVVGIQVGLSSSPQHYELSVLPTLTLIGSWVAALGTCSAVVVSLWLAFKQLAQDREILECQLNMALIPGYQDEPCIALGIVSKGNKPSNVLSISWFGENAETAILVTKFNQHSDSLPRVLSYGQKITILHVSGFESHLSSYVDKYLAGNFDRLYLVVNTTTESKKIKVPKDMGLLIKGSERADAYV